MDSDTQQNPATEVRNTVTIELTIEEKRTDGFIDTKIAIKSDIKDAHPKLKRLADVGCEMMSLFLDKTTNGTSKNLSK